MAKLLGLILFLNLLYPYSKPSSNVCPNRFGVVEHFNWPYLYTSETRTQAMTMMSEAGIQWVRFNWSWKDMQPQAGEFDYSHLDAVARDAAIHNLQLVPILFAVPAWASTAPPELIAERGNLSPVDRYCPADINTWLTYVQNVVERYDGDGFQDAPNSPRLAYWEVWNEPNISAFWPPKPDVEEYLDLLVQTHTTIKSADPTAKVILGGLAGPGVNKDGEGFLPAIYEAGGAGHFDIVSIHIYIHPTEGGIEDVQESIAATRAVMDNYGDTETPIWLTEIGWSDAENAWGRSTVSQEEIADFLEQVYTAPLDAEVIFWYNFRDIFPDSPDVEHNFGLVNADLTLKPAFERYAAVATAATVIFCN